MSYKSVLRLQGETAGFIPFLDMYETDDSLVLEMDVPGINPDEILIKVYDDIIMVEGIKRERHEGKSFKYLCMERSFESFRRMIRIPVPIDSLAAKASYNDGVITVIFPKKKSKVIKIRI